jgi:DnaJ family protein A protein 2
MGGGPGEADIFDLLMGGGRSRGNVKKKTKSILHTLKVSLEDIYLGNTKFLEISRYRVCQSCKGSGSKNPGANTTCAGCKGKGMKVVIQRIAMGMIQQTVECNDCHGEGQVIKEADKCKDCKAQKVKQEKKLLEVHVDKGANDGKRYVFAGESDQVPDVEAGDVIVELQVEKSKKFIRKGADLVYQADINLLEALTGFELVVEHLDKRKILVKSRPGEIVKPGELKTVKELGMPFFEQPFRYGNLYISFNIIFPEKVDENQTKTLCNVMFFNLDFPIHGS